MRLLRGLLGALCVVGVVTVAIFAIRSWQAAADREEAARAPQGRLPEGVRPLHYDLRLRVDPDRDDFSGQVGIDVEIDRATNELWIHGERITAQRTTLVLGDGQRLALEYREMGGSGVVRLSPSAAAAEQAIPAGLGRIEIEFTAPFDTQLEALYLIEANSKRYAISQLEPIDAREEIANAFDWISYAKGGALPWTKRAGARSRAQATRRSDCSEARSSISWPSRCASPGFLLSLRLNEIPTLIYSQSSRVENRAAVFAWLKRVFPIGRRFMPERYVATSPRMASGFCDAASRADLASFFSAYEDEIPGLGRNLSQAIERIELCESLVAR